MCPIPQAMTASSGNRTTGAMGGRRADVTVRPCSLCCVSVSCVRRLATDMLTLVNVWLKKILRSVTFSTHHTPHTTHHTPPDTAIHEQNGYAKLYDDNNIFITNVDNSDTTYANKHKHNMREV